jgi:hypothetical protein
MAKAIIYTITVSKACENSAQETFYSLNPWGANSLFYEGYDDGGKAFALPDGIAVGRGPDGDRILYEKNSGRSVEIDSRNGSPVLRYGTYRYAMGN